MSKFGESKSNGWYVDTDSLELIKQEKTTMRTFRLLKELPELKKGALVQTKNSGYAPINDSDIKYTSVFYSSGAVEKEPTFWVEVFQPMSQWLTKEELAKFNATVGAKKRGRPLGSKNKRKVDASWSSMPTAREVLNRTYEKANKSRLW